eukprot:Selendium_serpulae@DN7322_c0_g1_i2.p1
MSDSRCRRGASDGPGCTSIPNRRPSPRLGGRPGVRSGWVPVRRATATPRRTSTPPCRLAAGRCPPPPPAPCSSTAACSPPSSNCRRSACAPRGGSTAAPAAMWASASAAAWAVSVCAAAGPACPPPRSSPADRRPSAAKNSRRFAATAPAQPVPVPVPVAPEPWPRNGASFLLPKDGGLPGYCAVVDKPGPLRRIPTLPKPLQKLKPTLLQAQLLIRHGARTPSGDNYCWADYKPRWNCKVQEAVVGIDPRPGDKAEYSYDGESQLLVEPVPTHFEHRGDLQGAATDDDLELKYSQAHHSRLFDTESRTFMFPKFYDVHPTSNTFH